VKPRLSPALPAEHAARIHAAMLADTLATVAAAPAARRVVFWTEPPGDLDPAPGQFESHVQSETDLSARLTAAASMLMRQGHRVILVGCDCPGLTVPLLVQAIEALQRGDSVVGASADGSYWLLGLSREAPELFTGIDWESGRVLQQTLTRAASEGLSVTMLPLLADLDTPQDLALLVGHVAAGDPHVCGPRLVTTLRQLSLLP